MDDRRGIHVGFWLVVYLAWGFGEGDLVAGSILQLDHFLTSEGVKEKDTYDGVVGTTLSAKVHGLIIVDTFVDDAVGKHGLGCNSEYENAKGQIIRWLGILPHICPPGFFLS